nr:hypothetical protein Iba_chr03bCG19150 [Ipomoea batatas]
MSSTAGDEVGSSSVDEKAKGTNDNNVTKSRRAFILVQWLGLGSGIVLEQGAILGEEERDGVNPQPQTQTPVETILYEPNGIANGNTRNWDIHTISDLISEPLSLHLELSRGGARIRCDEFPEGTDPPGGDGKPDGVGSGFLDDGAWRGVEGAAGGKDDGQAEGGLGE